MNLSREDTVARACSPDGADERVEGASDRGTRLEPRVAKPEQGASAVAVAFPELRTGQWTRLGTDAVLGDSITENTLATLAESTRIAAGSQGYAVGWAEGQRAARAEAAVEAAAAEQVRRLAEDRRQAEHDAAVTALETAAGHLHLAIAGICATIESQASELAWELTRELVGHELSGPGIDVVQRALALLPTEPVVRIRMHPDDLVGASALTQYGAALVPDHGLQRGDALVEADDHVLDLRLDTALERVRQALA